LAIPPLSPRGLERDNSQNKLIMVGISALSRPNIPAVSPYLEILTMMEERYWHITKLN
jgi:hypothetical protein